jgi:FkbH-like protein
MSARPTSHEPLALLQAARTAAAEGDWQQAAQRLRAAFAERPDYTFHARAGGVVREVLANTSGRRPLRIAVLGSATLSLLTPVLKTLCFRDGIQADVYEGLFGAYRQEILDPASAFYRFNPDITFVVPTWRDLSLASLNTDDASMSVERTVAEHVKLWELIAARSRSHVVQHTFDLPAFESAGLLTAGHAAGRRAMIRTINLRLQQAALPFVSVLDTEHVMTTVGHANWSDPALWHRARQHPSAKALPALVEEQMAHIRAVTGLTRKVVVCDLDNTLWGGVIGEDGLAGIRIGGSSPEGEAHLELQRYLKELRARGVLLAVSSKNNPDEARLPFLEHPDMLLRLEDFAAFEANWDDKVTNLRRVAETLSLGIDSFVFLDDNPLERDWVRSQLPEVAVVELSASAANYVRELDGGRYFDVLAVSAEDRQRADMYRKEHEREALRAQAGSLEEFLAGLDMQATISEVNPQNLPRVAQLVNKTNQFNLTTRRYTEAQVAAIAATPRAWTGVFELADRFGQHGIVGLMFCVPHDTAAGDTWEIDTWLMSCRVLGRTLERFMLDRAIDAARAAGITRIVGTYRPTAKNGLVADLFERLGFTRLDGDGGDDQRYVLTISLARTPYSTLIRAPGEGQASTSAGVAASAP